MSMPKEQAWISPPYAGVLKSKPENAPKTSVAPVRRIYENIDERKSRWFIKISFSVEDYCRRMSFTLTSYSKELLSIANS